jgi:hypothetical protein
VPDFQILHFPVDHAFPLAVNQVLDGVYLGLFGLLVRIIFLAPPLQFLLQLFDFIGFGFSSDSGGGGAVVFGFENLILLKERLAYLVYFVKLVAVLFELGFVGGATVVQLADLCFEVGRVEDQPLTLLNLGPLGLDLLRESLDFDGLEDGNKGQVVAHAVAFVVW